MPRHAGKRCKVDATARLPSPLTPIAVNSSARERRVSKRARSVPIACEMVSAVIDVSVHVDVLIHVFHDDFLPRVIHIWSPIGDAINNSKRRRMGCNPAHNTPNCSRHRHSRRTRQNLELPH